MGARDPSIYRLTPADQRDLQDIWRDTARQLSVGQNDRHPVVLEDKRPEFNPLVRIHQSAEHLVIYQIDSKHLANLRVLGAGQHWQTILWAVDQ